MKPADKVYVVSDLHLGDGGVRDNFSYKDKRGQFTRFLDQVGDDELLILGDMFEFWQMNIDRAVMTNQGLLDRLAGMNVHYIPGNHDADLAGFADASGSLKDFLNHKFFRDRMKKVLARNYGGQSFIFRHGHEGDVYNDHTAPVLGRVAAIVAGLAEDRLKSRYLNKKQSWPLEVILITFVDYIEDLIDKFIKLLSPERVLLRSEANGEVDSEGESPLMADLRRLGEAPLPEAEKEAMFEALIRDKFNEAFEQVLAERETSPLRADSDESPADVAMDGIISDTANRWGPRRKAIPKHIKCMKEIWQAQADSQNTVLMAGHTHIPGRCGQWYANSGSWSDLGHDVLTIDPESGLIEFHQWEKGRLTKVARPEEFNDPD